MQEWPKNLARTKFLRRLDGHVGLVPFHEPDRTQRATRPTRYYFLASNRRRAVDSRRSPLRRCELFTFGARSSLSRFLPLASLRCCFGETVIQLKKIFFFNFFFIRRFNDCTVEPWTRSTFDTAQRSSTKRGRHCLEKYVMKFSMGVEEFFFCFFFSYWIHGVVS